jgi:hypothetical protein
MRCGWRSRQANGDEVMEQDWTGNDRLQDKFDKLEALNAEMLEALKAVQLDWNEHASFCPICHNARGISGHAYDCTLDALIARAEAQP